MQIETVLYIILAAIIALVIAGFQYYTKQKSMFHLNMLFLFLRFLTIFLVLVLLINPKLEQNNFTKEKPNLVIAIDNSSSIAYLKQDLNAANFYNKLIANKDLKEKFNIVTYTFGDKLQALDTMSFKEKQTNIADVFSQLSQIYKQTISPTILITDGNQTYGNSYEFSTNNYKQTIYPVILGDTIRYADLKIQQLNVNKYAFLKNQFPVEVFLIYTGDTPVNSKFVVTSGEAIIFSETVNFTKQENSKVINFKLPANKVGVHEYKALLEPLTNEKNSVNNLKNFAIEVIDQKTNIALVSDLMHPDLGVLKKAIETNEQRSVSILNSKDVISQLIDFQLIILYQPNNNFNPIIKNLDAENSNRFTIIGTKTDLSFINQMNKNYSYEITNQTENYQAVLSKSYNPFIIEAIAFESFPPLKAPFGSVTFNIPFETILHKTVNKISKQDPLLATFETNGRREAVLFGENLWQWRAQSYLNTNSFSEFDDFLGKLIQYLSSNKRRSRLNVEHESFYNGNTNVIIKAEYFDKNYEFDTRGTLAIKVENTVTKEVNSFPLILSNSNYQVDLSSLQASNYNFTISVSNENLSASGSFKILEYNVEQQFLNADVTKLQQLAMNSQGTSYFISDTNLLIENLLNDKQFASIQKNNKTQLALINWKFLLVLIALSLSAEWFLRKYNGLI